jgi:hypothetical protein
MIGLPWRYDDGGRRAAGFRGEAGDCVTRSIATATGLPYREVYDALAAGMGATRARGGGKRSAREGVLRRVYEPYLESLGWVWTPTMQIGSGCTVHLREGELPGGALVVSVSRHITAVIDGVVHDTYDPTSDGMRCVYGYYRIEPDEPPELEQL